MLYIEFGSIVIVLIALVASIGIWKFVMRNATTQDVLESTLEKRVNGWIVVGIINNFEEICDQDSLDEINIDDLDILDEEKDEIKKIESNESEYTKFKIFKATNNKYLIYFYTDGNLKEQLVFCFKVLKNNPLDILISYKIGYENIIFVKDFTELPAEVKYTWFKENYSFTTRLFGTQENVIDVNEDYEEYLDNFRSISEENFITKIFNKIELKLLPIFTAITKVNLYYVMPVTLIICICAFWIFRKSKSLNLTILEIIIILYGGAFGYIMGYVIFGHYIDRYIVPAMIPSFIADILLVILIIKCILEKIASKKILRLNEVNEKGTKE